MGNNFAPENSLLRFARQAVADVPEDDATKFRDMRISSEDLAMEAPTINTANLNPDSQRSVGLPSKFEGVGSYNLDPEPQAFSYWLAQFQKRSAAPTDLLLGAFSHKMAPSETVVNNDFPFTTRVYRDDNLIQTFTNMRAASIVLDAAVSSTVSCAVATAYERGTYYSFARVINEVATPEQPILRGIPKDPDSLSIADNSVFVHSVDGSSNTIEVKVGVAAAFSNQQVIVPGTWNTLQDEAGVDIGQVDSPVQLWVSTTAGWTLLDEWAFDIDSPAETVWKPSFPPLVALNEIHVTIDVDGTEVRFNTLQLSLAQTVPPRLNIGGRYPDGLNVQGQRFITGNLDRRVIDTDLRKRLEAGTPFSMSVLMTSRLDIGTSAFPFQWLFEFPLCRFSGRTYTIPGADAMPEPLSFDAYVDPSAPDPDDVTITAWNSIADLTA